MTPFPDRLNVLGVGVSATNLDEATDYVIRAALSGPRAGYVCVTGVHGVSEAQRDRRFRDILNNALLNTPDGMPMSWIGWSQGRRRMDRVYGPDLMLAVSDRGREHGLRHYYFGGREGVADRLAERMSRRFPGLDVVGTHCPPFRAMTDVELDALRRDVEAAAPHCLWVGLSTPKQERAASAFARDLDAHVILSVGAAFDFHAGLIPQAPRWMQRAGLEWLFRLIQEPRRLWKRYLINNPLFLLRITMQLTGLRRYSLE